MPAAIVEANCAEHFATARVLFEEYAQALGIDLCFQNFAAELQQMAEMYAAPRGCLLLAIDELGPAGCVALRPVAHTTCEMKRLYIRPRVRGKSLGRLLANAIIERASRLGYRTMALDTLVTMQAAQRLYRSLGFQDTAPYCANPLNGVVYMKLELPVRQ